MTVGELIAKLKQYPPSARVMPYEGGWAVIVGSDDEVAKPPKKRKWRWSLWGHDLGPAE